MSRRSGVFARRRQDRETRRQQSKDEQVSSQQRLANIYNVFSFVLPDVFEKKYVHPIEISGVKYFIGRDFEGQYDLLRSNDGGLVTPVKDNDVIKEYLNLSEPVAQNVEVINKFDPNVKGETYNDFKDGVSDIRSMFVAMAFDKDVDDRGRRISAIALKRINAKLLEKSWFSDDVVSLSRSNDDFHRLVDGARVVTEKSEYVRNAKDPNNLRQRLLQGLNYLCSNEEILHISGEMGIDLYKENSITSENSTDILTKITDYLGPDHEFTRYHRAFSQAVSEGQITMPAEDLQMVVDRDFSKGLAAVPKEGESGRECEVKIFKDKRGDFIAFYRSKANVGFMNVTGDNPDLSDRVECENYVTLNLSDKDAVPEVFFGLSCKLGEERSLPRDIQDRVAGYVDAVNGVYARGLQEVKGKFDRVSVIEIDEGIGVSPPVSRSTSPRSLNPNASPQINRLEGVVAKKMFSIKGIDNQSSIV